MKTCVTARAENVTGMSWAPDDDPGTVEDEEHDDGDGQDDGQIAVSLLLLQPAPRCLGAWSGQMFNKLLH